jgi:type VI secretion system secreted protein VgrG
MSADFQQGRRIGRLTTDLGPEELTLMSFRGHDHVNNLFEYRVVAHSGNDNIDFEKLIGTHASVELTTLLDEIRVFDGIVAEARWDGNTEFGYRYELVLRPWLWLAGRRRNQRIFHNLSVVEIIRKVLSAYSGLGSPALEVKLSASYDPLEYTVQYRESDMDFVVRLMERFGISYYFTHDLGSHTLNLSDDAFDLVAVPGETRQFYPMQQVGTDNEEHFWEWRAERRLTIGAVRLTDYNFKTPNAMMEVSRVGGARHAQGDIESYDYPNDYLDQTAGKTLVATRLKQELGQGQRHRATGNVLSLSAGATVTLKGHAIADSDGPVFVCLSAYHDFAEQAYTSGQGTGAGQSPYTASYVFMPNSAPLAPEIKTLIPRIEGPQTGMVVGEGEIDCDDYGRILVWFPWDRNDEKSMRCRVSQNWAGKGFGGVVIPRIGMEVVVEFLNGNPDYPLVTGCVYNGKNDPPYPLPANKTRSVFKTNSHQAAGFNEIRFEDQGGQEEIFIHAQKDRNEVTLHCHTEQIGVDWSQGVGSNKSIQVGNNHTETIGVNMDQMVGSNKSTTVGMNTTLTSGANIMQTAGANIVTTAGASMSTTIGASASTTVANDSTTNIGSDEGIMVGKSRTVAVGENQSVTIGKNATESVGKSKVVNAGDELKIIVGKSSITMKKDGTITIKGKDITLEGSGKINIKATGNVTVKGSKINQN